MFKKTKIISAIIAIMMAATGCTTQTTEPGKDNPAASTTSTATTSVTETTNPTDTSTPIPYIAQTNQTFSQNILKDLVTQNSNSTENVMLSPLSYKIAMNMVLSGTEDGSASQKELLEVLGYANLEEAERHTQTSMQLLSPEYKLDYGKRYSCNSAWSGSPILEGYSDTLSDVYKAEIFNVDLTTEEFMTKANDWVSTNTEKLIQNAIQKPMDSNEGVVLINTLYFNNDWKIEFNKDFTNKERFYGINEEVDVDMMHNTDEYYLYQGEDISAIKLYYKDGSFMTCYIPTDKTNNICEILKDFTLEQYAELENYNFEEAEVNLTMPKFEYNTSLNSNNMLNRLGITKVFNPNEAQITKISANNLFISDVIQMTKIKCDEKGTEAAAATTIMMNGTAIQGEKPKPIEFKIDCPFVYTITDGATNEIMFTGLINQL